jgi:uncharacterized membrane protein YesL
MLLLALFSGWPYGYYTLLRLVVFVTSCLIAIAAYRMQQQGWVVGIGIIALLFNPFIPVHLDKSTWRILDFIVAFIFAILLFRIKAKERNE